MPMSLRQTGLLSVALLCLLLPDGLVLCGYSIMSLAGRSFLLCRRKARAAKFDIVIAVDIKQRHPPR